MKTTAVEATSDHQPDRTLFRFKDEEQVPSEAWEFYDSQRLSEADVEEMFRLDEMRRKTGRTPREI